MRPVSPPFSLIIDVYKNVFHPRPRLLLFSQTFKLQSHLIETSGLPLFAPFRPFSPLFPPLSPSPARCCKLMWGTTVIMQNSYSTYQNAAWEGVPKENDWAEPELSLQPHALDMHGVAGGAR